MAMKVGDKVITLGDLSELKSIYGYDYPVKLKPLTIKRIEPHHNEECNEAGINILWFEECELPFGMCDRNVQGELLFAPLKDFVIVE